MTAKIQQIETPSYSETEVEILEGLKDIFRRDLFHVHRTHPDFVLTDKIVAGAVEVFQEEARRVGKRLHGSRSRGLAQSQAEVQKASVQEPPATEVTPVAEKVDEAKAFADAQKLKQEIEKFLDFYASCTVTDVRKQDLKHLLNALNKESKSHLQHLAANSSRRDFAFLEFTRECKFVLKGDQELAVAIARNHN